MKAFGNSAVVLPLLKRRKPEWEFPSGMKGSNKSKPLAQCGRENIQTNSVQAHFLVSCSCSSAPNHPRSRTCGPLLWNKVQGDGGGAEGYAVKGVIFLRQVPALFENGALLMKYACTWFGWIPCTLCKPPPPIPKGPPKKLAFWQIRALLWAVCKY